MNTRTQFINSPVTSLLHFRYYNNIFVRREVGGHPTGG
jgi:hypothetical protein